MGLDAPTSVFPLASKDHGAQMGGNRLSKFNQSIYVGHPLRELASPSNLFPTKKLGLIRFDFQNNLGVI
jgi:hypothetical protein